MEESAIYRESYPEGTERAVTAIVASLRNVPDLNALRVSSVKGIEFDAALSAACEAELNLTPHFCTTGCVSGFPSAYDLPQLLGVDRYINLVCAREDYPLPCIVIDAGTAVTFDALDQHGQHQGGCIFPGIGLLGRTLLQDTARILTVANDQGNLFGKSTAEGAAGGVHGGFVEAVDGITRRMQQQMGADVTVIVTGGDAGMLGEALSLPLIVDHLLTFKGIKTASCQNT